MNMHLVLCSLVNDFPNQRRKIQETLNLLKYIHRLSNCTTATQVVMNLMHFVNLQVLT